MNRIIRTLFVTAVAVSAAGSASAQSTIGEELADQKMWHGSVGMSSLAADGLDWYSPGMVFAAGLEMPYGRHQLGPFSALISLQGDVSLAFFGMDNAEFERRAGGSGNDISGGSLMAVTGFANIKATLAERGVRPYVLAGAGMLKWMMTDIEINGQTFDVGEMEDQIALNAGAGVSLRPTGAFEVYAEAKMVRTLAGEGFQPLSVGARIFR